MPSETQQYHPKAMVQYYLYQMQYPHLRQFLQLTLSRQQVLHSVGVSLTTAGARLQATRLTGTRATQLTLL